MNLKELLVELTTSNVRLVPPNTEVKILVNGKKESIDYLYVEDYSDGKLQIVLVQKGNNDKNN